MTQSNDFEIKKWHAVMRQLNSGGHFSLDTAGMIYEDTGKSLEQMEKEVIQWRIDLDKKGKTIAAANGEEEYWIADKKK
jgi:hypothetical protein